MKTVCTTNCTWALTRMMVRALVSELGRAGRRAPRRPARERVPHARRRWRRTTRPSTGRSSAAATGRRGSWSSPRWRRRARSTSRPWGRRRATSCPDEEVERQLLALPGVGPYAAAHIMMTLGRNSKPILDSWTRPTYARLTGRRRPPADAAIARRFRAYGPEAGLAFWLFVTREWVETTRRPRGCPSPEPPAILPGASPAPPRRHAYERGGANREGVPMVRPCRVLARRARRLLGYWRSERRTLRQGLVALALSTLAGFVAGLTLAHLTGTLDQLPGLLDPDPRRGRDARHDLRRDRGAPGHGERVGRADPRPAPGRGPAPQRRAWRLYTTFSSALWLAIARQARLGRLRAALDLARGTSSIDLGLRRPAGLGPGPAASRWPCPRSPTGAVGPRRRLDADGDRDRRHGHDAQPVPGDGPARPRRRQRGARRGRDRGGGGRRGAGVPGARPSGCAGSWSRWRPRSPSRPCSTCSPARCWRRAWPSSTAVPGAARADPAVRLAGGRPRRDLLVAALVEAPARRDHAPRPARAARRRRRPASWWSFGLRCSR